ncbi:cell division cycle protein 23 homolog [Gigantopelta aegis]|uniref:cell division cycle protein 23 homolog n=1 Tax=Gigantopelta aegis TaxID=1735272 RepID=UPI001B888619|nr:cell division cycle protein 23 homolog [Gigantopelta aegis]
MADFKMFDLARMKTDLIRIYRECTQRRLLQGAKWASEMFSCLDVEIDVPALLQVSESQDFWCEFDKYCLATSYFDLKEYSRAANVVESCSSRKAYFIHVYARYLADEKCKLDNASDSLGSTDLLDNETLKILRNELSKKKANKELDGFGLYLYGVILRKLDLVKDAMGVFVEAVNKEPLHRGAWQELALLITDRETLQSLQLPDHWSKQLFLAYVYLELQLNEEALKIYQQFLENGFAKCNYIVSQIAVCYHNKKEMDQAVTAFSELQKMDPYRVENMDIFSNLLYVKEMRADLARLAHQCCDIDKYRVETCCVIGNYYSLRSQHEKAVLYFQRALKLNPHYLSARTLIGHEFMEMKNISAAIQAYRLAIEVNKRDYRAWYGLGQTYEILKMPSYSLYYFRQAQQLRPNDSRMLVALGDCYANLERLQEAKKCFWKAHSIGDVEGMALIKLATLYEKLQEDEQAAFAYTDYITEMERQGGENVKEQSRAYKYLAHFYLKRRMLDDAYTAAQKCYEFTETREEAKALLKQIQNLRSQLDEPKLDDSYDSLMMERLRGPEHTPLGRISPMNLRFTPD